MDIPTRILDKFPELNEAQLEAIGHSKGPLLIIAGPGSGKTKVLIVRTLSLLLKGLARPEEILLCTFTEKASFELRDRLSLAAKELSYEGDLSQLLVGTIHGICNDFLLRYRDRLRHKLGHSYEVLDDLTQLLFIFDYFDEIIGAGNNGPYLNRWKTRWKAIEGVRDYFNKITEELIDVDQLLESLDPFISAIGSAYKKYVSLLFKTNRVDFAHLQKLFLELLENPEVSSSIKKRIRYIMVDEYQDTNYIQEQLLLRLARPEANICVVGDEDQALYRFRGATVRNILEFSKHFKDCHIIPLTINYRSHENIVRAYDKFMSSCDWHNPRGDVPFRYAKKITPDPEGHFPDYPAVFSIWGKNKKDEAKRFADLVLFLKENRVIEDENQVALLLHSVRRDNDAKYNYSGPYIDALESRGIRAYCPRARGYFENEEIKLVIGYFAILLGFYGDSAGTVIGRSQQKLRDYVDRCIRDLGRKCSDPHPIAKLLQRDTAEIEALTSRRTLDRHLNEYFYELISYEPLAGFLKKEHQVRNLATFSQLLNVFQNYYHYSVITARNRVPLKFHFFSSFLRLLYEGGKNEYEDPDEPFPKGHVQIMTVHQSKGLEFPITVVNSLATQLSSKKAVDVALSPYYHRHSFESGKQITEFDRMRLHYVAFSRAEKVLVLTTSEQPSRRFSPIWEGLPQWPYVQKDLLKAQSFSVRKRIALKRVFSFSSDLKVYETCPRQYEFYRLYGFTPARSAQFLFGSLVHQTIEDIHKAVLDRRGDELNHARIEELFDFNYRHLRSE